MAAMFCIETAAGETPQEAVTRLNRRVVKLYKEGDLAAAMALARQTVAKAEAALGPNHADYADSLNNLAALHKANGRYTEALPLLEKAVAVSRRALGDDHPSVADVLNNLAVLYKAMGRFEDAEPLYKQAIEAWRREGDDSDPGRAVSLNNLAGLYFAMRRYRDAEPLYREALAVKLRSLGRNDPSYATSLNNLAELYRSMGRCQDAEPLYKKALDIRKRALGTDHPDYAVSVNNLAVLYDSMGKETEAAALYREAMAVWPKSLGPDHPDFAAIISNRASFCRSTGKNAEAETLLRKAAAGAKKALGEGHPTHTACLSSLAALYHSTGRYDEAQMLYEQVLEAQHRAMGNDDPGYAATLYDLGSLHAARGRAQEALRLVLQAFDVEAETLIGAFAVSTEGQRSQWLRTIWPTIRAVHTLVAVHLPSDSHARREGLRVLLRTKGVPLEEMMGVRRGVPQQAPPAVEAKLDELSKAYQQISFTTLFPSAITSLAGYRDEVRRIKKTRRRLEAELAALSREFALTRRVRHATVDVVRAALPSDAVLLSFYRFPLYDFEERKTLFERYFVYILDKASGVPLLVDLGYASVIDKAAEDFRHALQDPAADVRIASRRLHSLVFVPIAKHLGDVSRLVVAADGRLNLVPFGALWDGNRFLQDRFTISYLDAGRDVVRFGERGAAPGEMVLIADPDLDLSPQALAGSAGGAEPTKGAVGPMRSARLEGMAFKRLRAARAEGQTVCRVFEAAGGKTRRYERREALVSVLKAAPVPRVLHLAVPVFFLDNTFSHEIRNPVRERGPYGLRGELARDDDPAEAAADNPLLCSGLALAGANHSPPAGAGTEDGIATSLELSRLDLRGVELVVLSACHANMGVRGIEGGVCGLRRSLICAGADAVLMSLWPVDERAKRLLLERFYANWLDGMAKAEALREAKRWLIDYERQDAAGGGAWSKRRQTVKKAYAHPCYWASFVLVGDWK